MEQTEYSCKDCVLFNDEDPGCPYCMENTYIHT
nr:MAG TPA: Glutaredoxin [Caudoviricetes sp.]